MSIVPVLNFCASISDPTLCGSCLTGNRFRLHHVPIHHTSAYLCTSCVLRLYPELFCPICFEVYESPTEENVVICSECCRSTHFHCVSTKSTDPYICASCVDPNSLIFVVDRKSGAVLENVSIEDCRKMDKKGGMIFLAATMIVVGLTRKAADAARVVADRKAVLASLAKGRVMAAMEYVSKIHTSENLRGVQVDEPANELGSNNGVGSYSCRGAGAGAGRCRGRGRGRAAGYSSRGHGRVHGLAACGGSRGRGAKGAQGSVRGLAASHSDSDYVGSSRTCKRKYPVQNTDKKVVKQGKATMQDETS